MKITDQYVEAQVRVALAEDVGAGDRTAALVPAKQTAAAELWCREAAVLCGRQWFSEVFRQLDPAISLDWQANDGDRLLPEQVVCRLRGRAAALLTGERVALNFLQTLSGTATLAARFVDRVEGTGARILDTRKTIPGLRLAQKYAVRCGGGGNHRIGLYDAVLIKENHIRAAGSIGAALTAARDANPDPSIGIEIEVENLTELDEALAAGAGHLLLDNFDLAQLTEAVQRSNGRARLEASGGIDIDAVRAIAETGVDEISVGALTKDVRAVDFSLLFRL